MLGFKRLIFILDRLRVCVLEVTAARREPVTGLYGHDDGHSGSIQQQENLLKKPNSYYKRFMIDTAPCGYSWLLTSKPSAVKFTFVIFFIPYSNLCLHAHCRCKELLLYLLTHNSTHTHSAGLL